MATLEGKVLLPNHSGYKASFSTYFAQQPSQIQPACIVKVTQAADVVGALKTISKISQALHGSALSQCRFAVRSGGHASIEDAANIEGGVTLDLSALNTISITDGMVSVGPGATWDEVYRVLDLAGLAVAGGRTAGVGVGGLTVGGGISFFSPRQGWTTDTIINYQVALANGKLISANARNNSDLLWALRCGGNNFGVVTRVDLRTFKQGQVWGGFSFHNASTIEQSVQAFVDFAAADAYDEYSSVICSFILLPGQDPAIANNIVHTQAIENPPSLRNLTSIPSSISSFRFASTTGLSEELAAQQTYGVRQLSATLTHKPTLAFIKQAWARYLESCKAIQGVANRAWTLSFEPVPPSFYNRNSKGNALGLEDRTEPLVGMVLNAAWVEIADDETVMKAARSLIEALKTDAKRLKAHDNFVYLSYAASWQDPISSYGAGNVARLNGIKRRYDSKSVFTRLSAGGFKIPNDKSEDCKNHRGRYTSLMKYQIDIDSRLIAQ